MCFDGQQQQLLVTSSGGNMPLSEEFQASLYSRAVICIDVYGCAATMPNVACLIWFASPSKLLKTIVEGVHFITIPILHFQVEYDQLQRRCEELTSLVAELQQQLAQEQQKQQQHRQPQQEAALAQELQQLQLQKQQLEEQLCARVDEVQQWETHAQVGSM